MTKKYHPDINPNSLKKYKEINEAYSTLSDKQKRSEYDMKLTNPSSSSGGFGGSSGAYRAQNQGQRDYSQYYRRHSTNESNDPFGNQFYGFRGNEYQNRVNSDFGMYF